ncbi:MAG: helix-turn-helix domain-containing protein [Acidimicrobiales bacterium]
MLTVPEVARRLGRNPETVRRWIRSGRLPATKVGTQHVVEERDVDLVADAGRLPLPKWLEPDPAFVGIDWATAVRDVRDSG